MAYHYEVFESLPRCGPGDNESTRRAYNAFPKCPDRPYILDIGCGTGLHTLELAKASGGHIVALDNHQPFLDKLMIKAQKEGLADRIIPRHMSMHNMDFEEETFDIIWSEGALYFMGFRDGLRRCRQLLKNHAYLAVTEAVFLSPAPPAPVIQFWEKEYPDIKDIETTIKVIRGEGFSLLSNFTLPESAWFESFYLPMEEVLLGLNEKYRENETALKVFKGFQEEIDFYKRYSDDYGYEFFVMQKVNG
jgi:SAM-dependent methyltransferase